MTSMPAHISTNGMRITFISALESPRWFPLCTVLPDSEYMCPLSCVTRHFFHVLENCTFDSECPWEQNFWVEGDVPPANYGLLLPFCYAEMIFLMLAQPQCESSALLIGHHCKGDAFDDVHYTMPNVMIYVQRSLSVYYKSQLPWFGKLNTNQYKDCLSHVSWVESDSSDWWIHHWSALSLYLIPLVVQHAITCYFQPSVYYVFYNMNCIVLIIQKDLFRSSLL